MALAEWMRTSVDAISLAQRLRQTGRQDLIEAVERSDMSLVLADCFKERMPGIVMARCPLPQYCRRAEQIMELGGWRMKKRDWMYLLAYGSILAVSGVALAHSFL